MIVKHIFNNFENKLQIPTELLPEGGVPFSHHFQSTDYDNLIELSGRACFDKETELLTENGWVKLPELERGVKVLTFNKNKNVLQYQVPTDYIKKKYNDQFIVLDNDELDIKTTKDHDWFVNINNKWEFIKAGKLIGYKGYIKRCAEYRGESNKKFIIPDYEYNQILSNKFGTYGESKSKISKGFSIPNYLLSEFASFLGYYFSEGCITGGNYSKKSKKKSGLRISLYQSVYSSQPIIDCIKKLKFKYSIFLDKRNNVNQIVVYNASLARYLSRFGTNSKNKKLPRECLLWPSHLRTKLLNALFYGDGGRQYGVHRIFTSSSQYLADDIQELIFKSNKIASLSCVADKFVVRECSSINSTFNNPSSPIFSSKKEKCLVYCVSVPNRILVTRRNGCITFSGNCYDSCKSPQTRNSVEYHKHINEVGHGSVQGHVNLTFAISVKITDNTPKNLLETKFYIDTAARSFLNIPGIYVYENNQTLYVTCNVRIINECYKHIINNNLEGAEYYQYIWNSFKRLAKQVCPFSITENFINFKGVSEEHNPYIIELVSPIWDDSNDNNLWLSFYISGVSRGLTHELVRHGWRTAISQRSTRYVDESKSEWAWHPLFEKYSEQLSNLNNHFLHKAYNGFILNPWCIQPICSETYDQVVTKLQDLLINDGVDKFTARKQARGAARGLLGNALSTELVWSCNMWELKEIIRQRANAHADAEIRILANRLYEITSEKFPSRFPGYRTIPCSDGIGYEVTTS